MTSCAREDSVRAILHAIEKGDGKIGVITQKHGENPNPKFNKDELYSIGTLCEICKHVKFTDGSMKVMLKGISTFKAAKVYSNDGINTAEVIKLTWPVSKQKIDQSEKEEVIQLLEKYNPSSVKEKLLTTDSLDSFVLHASQIIAHPYSGIQKKTDAEKLLRDLDYWNQLPAANVDDVNRRIEARIPLLSNITSADKLKIIKVF